MAMARKPGKVVKPVKPKATAPTPSRYEAALDKTGASPLDFVNRRMAELDKPDDA
jgi:hypothetical protein